MLSKIRQKQYNKLTYIVCVFIFKMNIISAVHKRNQVFGELSELVELNSVFLQSQLFKVQ